MFAEEEIRLTGLPEGGGGGGGRFLQFHHRDLRREPSLSSVESPTGTATEFRSSSRAHGNKNTHTHTYTHGWERTSVYVSSNANPRG